MRDANAFAYSWSVVFIFLLVVGTVPTTALAQTQKSSETDTSSIPELRESSRGEISADSGEETWTRQLAFQTARSVDSFVEGLEADLGEPVRDHSRIRKQWTWSGVSFPGLVDSTTTIRVEALVVHDPTPVFIRLRNAEEGNLLAEDAEGQQPIMSYLQKMLKRAYSDQ